MVAMAAARGLATRVGLEDGRELPGGAVAAGNAALVAEAARMLGMSGAARGSRCLGAGSGDP